MAIPLPKVFWPRVVSSSDNAIPVRYGGVTYTATIAPATYYSAESLRAAVASALAAAVPALGFTVSLDLIFPGGLSFFGAGAFEFWWASAPTNIAAAHLGFLSGLNSVSSGNRIDSAFQIPNSWYAPIAVADDTRELPDREGDRMTIAMSGQSKRIQEVELRRRTITFQFVDAARTLIASETGTRVNAAAERWWGSGAARFRYWADRSAESSFDDYVLDQESLRRFEPRRMFPAPELYAFELKFRRHVP